MLAIRKLQAAAGVTVTDTPAPEAIPHGWVQLKVKMVGVCGTDLHIYNWDAWAQGRIKPPLTLGHELVGTVVGHGAGVDAAQFPLGGRYSAECHVVNPLSQETRTGRAHLCPDTKILGVDMDGAMADYVLVPASNLWPISDDIPNHHAAIFDPLGNAMHTCQTVPLGGKRVLITGAGPIGLMCVAMAKALGAYEVIVSEVNPARRALAAELGAVVTAPEDLTKTLAGRAPEVVLELSGHPAALRQGLQVVAAGGDVVLLGIPAGEVSLPVAEQIIFRGLKLHGVVGRRMYDTWYQVEAFVRQNGAVVERLISHQLPARDVQQAFDLLCAGQANKIILEF